MSTSSVDRGHGRLPIEVTGRCRYGQELPAEVAIPVCEQCAEESLTRRRFLVLSGTGVAAGLLLPGVSAAQSRSEFSATPIGNGHVVFPRDVWGANLPPKGPMEFEAPDDVRFLIVHHSASTNDYSAERSTAMLQSFYHFHTSPEKGWPDIAYNFLVDRHGEIFEGRAGSISSPVRGDATGGSQGFALLCCFIGDHSAVAPTAAAQSAMISLLAWLAKTYDIDTNPGSTAEFVSRGSNLHPSGTAVRTPTITGHRTMSRTTCPGDAAFELVEGSFPALVSAAVAGTTPALPEPDPSRPAAAADPAASSDTPTAAAVQPTGSTTGTAVSTSGSVTSEASESTAPISAEPAARGAPSQDTASEFLGAASTASTGLAPAISAEAPQQGPQPVLEKVPETAEPTIPSGENPEQGGEAASVPIGARSDLSEHAARWGLAVAAGASVVTLLWPAIWLGRRISANLNREHQPVPTASPGQGAQGSGQAVSRQVRDTERPDRDAQAGAGP